MEMKWEVKNNPSSRLCSNLDEVIAFYEEWKDTRENLDYDVDGIVVKVNSTEQRNLLGTTAKSPRWAISFKFPARQATTRIRDIRIQVGRTGALTPVAILEPVELSGITISRSTLHNEEEIKRKDIRIGDIVLIERSGDVIPKVVSAMNEKRTGEETTFEWPLACPVCNSETFKPEGEAIARCTNSSCPAKIRESILHFASRRAMNIEHLGVALVEQLLKEGVIKNIPDLYTLTLGDLVDLERMGPKSSQNVLDEIKRSKHKNLDRLIFALGIRYVGQRTAWALAIHFKTMDTLARAAPEELTKIEDVGPKVAESVAFFFKQPENIKVIEKLHEEGLNFTFKGEVPGRELPLTGKIFVITGKLETLTRDEAAEAIRALGGSVSISVSSRTEYVVVGESPGSKLAKAQKLGIKTLDEKGLKKLLGEG
jgi:DNA ligase (NAD+)